MDKVDETDVKMCRVEGKAWREKPERIGVFISIFESERAIAKRSEIRRK